MLCAVVGMAAVSCASIAHLSPPTLLGSSSSSVTSRFLMLSCISSMSISAHDSPIDAPYINASNSVIQAASEEVIEVVVYTSGEGEGGEGGALKGKEREDSIRYVLINIFLWIYNPNRNSLTSRYSEYGYLYPPLFPLLLISTPFKSPYPDLRINS